MFMGQIISPSNFGLTFLPLQDVNPSRWSGFGSTTQTFNKMATLGGWRHSYHTVPRGIDSSRSSKTSNKISWLGIKKHLEISLKPKRN
jgi:hypothetical protein